MNERSDQHGAAELPMLNMEVSSYCFGEGLSPRCLRGAGRGSSLARRDEGVITRRINKAGKGRFRGTKDLQ